MLNVIHLYLLIFTILGAYIVLGRRKKKPCKEDVRTLIVLGSGIATPLLSAFLQSQQHPAQESRHANLAAGGHTAEMLALLKSFPLNKYSTREYVVAATDRMSAQKAERFESSQNLSTPAEQVKSVPAPARQAS